MARERNVIGSCVFENCAIPFTQFPVKLILLLKNNSIGLVIESSHFREMGVSVVPVHWFLPETTPVETGGRQYRSTQVPKYPSAFLHYVFFASFLPHIFADPTWLDSFSPLHQPPNSNHAIGHLKRLGLLVVVSNPWRRQIRGVVKSLASSNLRRPGWLIFSEVEGST